MGSFAPGGGVSRSFPHGAVPSLQAAVQPVTGAGPEHGKPLEKADALFSQERDPRFSDIYGSITTGGHECGDVFRSWDSLGHFLGRAPPIPTLPPTVVQNIGTHGSDTFCRMCLLPPFLG